MIHVFLGGRGLLPVEGPLKKGKKAHRPAPRFVQLQFLQLRHHRTKEDGEAHQNFASNVQNRQNGTHTDVTAVSAASVSKWWFFLMELLPQMVWAVFFVMVWAKPYLKIIGL